MKVVIPEYSGEDPVTICNADNSEVSKKPTASGRMRYHCPRCGKFLKRNEYHLQPRQYFEIAQLLEEIDERLGEIWGIAFHHPTLPKLEKGLPKYGLGDVFVAVHEAQRYIREVVAE